MKPLLIPRPRTQTPYRHEAIAGSVVTSQWAIEEFTLGLAIGTAGVLLVVPMLEELAYGFGLLQIVWFVWLGAVMLRTTASRADSAVQS